MTAAISSEEVPTTHPEGCSREIKPFQLVKFCANIPRSKGNIEISCLEFSNQFLFFINDSLCIGTLIEASPDDPVDVGFPTTYDTQTIFGKDELLFQLLARRIVEIARKRILIALSVRDLSMEDIRLIESRTIEFMKPPTEERNLNGYSGFIPAATTGVECRLENIHLT